MGPETEQHIQERLLQRADSLCAWIQREMRPELRGLIHADDIFQEVAAAAFRSPSARHLRTPQDWDRWLRRVAKTRLALALRTQRRLKRLPPGLIGEHMQSGILRQLPANGRTPSRSVSAREFTYALRVALASLPESVRVAIELKLFEERTDDEIAATLNKSKEAVRGILYRGLARLRERLGDASRFFSGASPYPQPDRE